MKIVTRGPLFTTRLCCFGVRSDGLKRFIKRALKCCISGEVGSESTMQKEPWALLQETAEVGVTVVVAVVNARKSEDEMTHSRDCMSFWRMHDNMIMVGCLQTSQQQSALMCRPLPSIVWSFLSSLLQTGPCQPVFFWKSFIIVWSYICGCHGTLYRNYVVYQVWVYGDYR